MSKRSAKRTLAIVKARRSDHDRLRDPKGFRRPGSRSQHKSMPLGRKR